jgi:hypothetical protein
MTRTYMTGAFMVAGLISFGMINPYYLILDFNHKL